MPSVRPRTTLYLWEFLLQLLDGKDSCLAISWLNREKGEFVLKDQGEIAKLWGKVKGRPHMDKIKLGRAMRYYYKKKLLVKVPRRKAVYRFVKFDVLKQKTHRINDEVSDVDFNEETAEYSDIKFEKSNDELVFKFEKPNEEVVSCLCDKNDDDMPLESLLAEKSEVFTTRQDQKSDSKLFHADEYRSEIQSTCSSYTRSNSFMDYNSNLTSSDNSTYKGNSCSDTRTANDFVNNNYLNGYSRYGEQVEHNNSMQFNGNVGTSNSVAALLYKSMFVSEDFEQKENIELQQPTYGMPFDNIAYRDVPYENVPYDNVPYDNVPYDNVAMARNDDAADPSMSSSCYLDDMDSDSALNNAFKELERLVMLKKLIGT